MNEDTNKTLLELKRTQADLVALVHVLGVGEFWELVGGLDEHIVDASGITGQGRVERSVGTVRGRDILASSI